MLPCRNCAYRESIPGDCHISCQFDWQNAPLEVQKGYPVNQSNRSSQWFIFPYNFDPVWGPDECPARADQRDPQNVAKDDPLLKLFSMLK